MEKTGWTSNGIYDQVVRHLLFKLILAVSWPEVHTSYGLLNPNTMINNKGGLYNNFVSNNVNLLQLGFIFTITLSLLYLTYLLLGY